MEGKNIEQIVEEHRRGTGKNGPTFGVKDNNEVFEQGNKDIYGAIDFFKENSSSQVEYDLWMKDYFDNPSSLFGEDNFEKLRYMPSGERLILLARASYYLINTPDMAELYYSYFPEDLLAVTELFKSNGGQPTTSLEFNLFSISAEQMLKVDPNIEERYSSINQYLEMVDRRKLAPGILMGNFEYKLELV